MYLCLDHDSEGTSAALCHAEKLFPQAKLVWLSKDVKDPSEFVERGHTKEEFAGFLTQANDFVEYRVTQIDTKIDKLSLPDLLRPCVEMIATLDPAKAYAYLRYRIAPRYSFGGQELSSYKATVNKLRKGLNVYISFSPLPYQGREGRMSLSILLYASITKHIAPPGSLNIRGLG